MPSSDRITWREPYRQTLNRAMSEAKSIGLLRPIFWLRSLGLAVLIVGIPTVWMVWAYPAIVLPWPQLIAGAVVSPVFIAAAMAAILCMPCRIRVRREWIEIQQGQSLLRLKRSDIEQVTLDVKEDHHVYMTVTFRSRNGTPCARSVCVAESVDLEALANLAESFELVAATQKNVSHQSE